MADFSPGDHVLADFGAGDGYVIAHYVSGPDGPESKHTIQKPDGGTAPLTWREPDDVAREGGKTGGTFKAV